MTRRSLFKTIIGLFVVKNVVKPEVDPTLFHGGRYWVGGSGGWSGNAELHWAKPAPIITRSIAEPSSTWIKALGGKVVK